MTGSDVFAVVPVSLRRIFVRSFSSKLAFSLTNSLVECGESYCMVSEAANEM